MWQTDRSGPHKSWLQDLWTSIGCICLGHMGKTDRSGPHRSQLQDLWTSVGCIYLGHMGKTDRLGPHRSWLRNWSPSTGYHMHLGHLCYTGSPGLHTPWLEELHDNIDHIYLEPFLTDRQARAMSITTASVGEPKNATLNYIARYYCILFTNLAGLVSSCHLNFTSTNMATLRHNCTDGTPCKGYPQLYN